MTWSTSDVAVCCSSASLSSRASRTTSVSSPAEDELERGTAFGALRRFGPGALRRRPLIVSPPALERRFIASPRRLSGNRSRSKAYPGSGLFLCV